MTPPPSAHDILFFWFGPRPYSAARVVQHSRIWFGEPDSPEITPQADELVRDRFGETRQGRLVPSVEDPSSALLGVDEAGGYILRPVFRTSYEADRGELRAVFEGVTDGSFFGEQV